MVGAQFKSHKTGIVKTTIIAADNPVMQGFKGFESWDETYVHTKHNSENRTLLEIRGDEPWTWISFLCGAREKSSCATSETLGPSLGR